MGNEIDSARQTAEEWAALLPRMDLVLKGLPVYQDGATPRHDEDGCEVLFIIVELGGREVVCVHPDRWAAFCNQFGGPE